MPFSAIDPAGRILQSGDGAQRRRLAAARWAQQRHQFAAPYAEGHIVHRAHIAVIDDKIADIDADIGLAHAGSPE